MTGGHSQSWPSEHLCSCCRIRQYAPRLSLAQAQINESSQCAPRHCHCAQLPLLRARFYTSGRLDYYDAIQAGLPTLAGQLGTAYAIPVGTVRLRVARYLYLITQLQEFSERAMDTVPSAQEDADFALNNTVGDTETAKVRVGRAAARARREAQVHLDQLIDCLFVLDFGDDPRKHPVGGEQAITCTANVASCGRSYKRIGG